MTPKPRLHHRAAIVLGAVVVGVGMLAAGGAVPVGSGHAPDVREVREVREIRDVREVVVPVGGSTIRALCTGSRPRVVLLHGDGQTADAWLGVLQRLDGRVDACAYDRPGSGGSGPKPSRRGWFELLDEMRRVHAALGADQGYVLVGQGLGGLYARLYALDRPRELGGLVLVDPAHEDLPGRMRTGMPDAAWSTWTEARRRPNADGLVEARIADRARGSRLPALPLTVLTATRYRSGDGWDARFLREATRQVHASILRGVPRARHVPAEGSGPDIHRDDPDLVAREILRVVQTARRPRPGDAYRSPSRGR